MSRVPVNLCTNLCVTICKQRAGLGLPKSTVFYMDMPVLYIAPKLWCDYRYSRQVFKFTSFTVFAGLLLANNDASAHSACEGGWSLNKDKAITLLQVTGYSTDTL